MVFGRPMIHDDGLMKHYSLVCLHECCDVLEHVD